MTNSCPRIRECMKLNVKDKRISDDLCPKTRIKGVVTETCWKVGNR